jgi:hypothetical protein
VSKLSKQGVPLLDGPRNGRRRDVPFVPPAKPTRCQHVFGTAVDDWGWAAQQCASCGHIRGERTGRGFR